MKITKESVQKMQNADLKEIYNKGELDFHSGFNESMMLLGLMESWQGKYVLEIGCGEGHLASILNYAGAKVLGIDFAKEQIVKAVANYTRPNLKFRVNHFKQLGGEKYNVVIMQGVLEHLDKPWFDLSHIINSNLAEKGSVILSVPNWTNPRGYVYHTLRLLYGAPMSLTDIHYFVPADFQKYAEGYGYKIKFTSTDFSWGAGKECIEDLAERIPKAIPDISMDRLKDMMNYFGALLGHYKQGPLDGACLGMRIDK